MFDKIKELVEQLAEGDFTKYNNAKRARKVLQEIKVESQKLRNLIMDEHKKSKE